jgi:hypothetical protein
VRAFATAAKTWTRGSQTGSASRPRKGERSWPAFRPPNQGAGEQTGHPFTSSGLLPVPRSTTPMRADGRR